MRNLVCFLFLLVSTLSGITAEPVYRSVRVSTNFLAKVQEIWSKDHCIIVEGVWSNTNSAPEVKPDYFVVWSKNSDGGRILRMDPFKTDSNGVTQPPRFTDILSGESEVLPYKTVGSPGEEEYYHHGVLTIGNDQYNVAVAYGASLAHPAVLITWGTGSDIFDVGTVADTFEQVSISDKAITDKLSIKYYASKEIDQLNGTYLAVITPREYGQFTVKFSTDLTHWNVYDVPPLGIFGEIVIYKLPDTGSAFFSIE